MNNLKLKDKVMFITGAGDGIGKSIAIMASKEGASIAIFGRNAEKQEAVKKTIEEVGGKAITFIGDAGKEEDFKNSIEGTVKAYGTIDILVNNASIIAVGLLHEHSSEDWKNVINCNVNGYFYAAKYAIPYMLKQGSGNIVNISAASGMRPLNTGSAYTSSKAAVIQMTRTMAAEYASSGIRVNSVSPGVTMTNMLRFVTDEYLKGLEAVIHMRRVGQPEEIAKAVIFLASDDASYITGDVLSVDGGLIL